MDYFFKIYFPKFKIKFSHSTSFGLLPFGFVYVRIKTGFLMLSWPFRNYWVLRNISQNFWVLLHLRLRLKIQYLQRNKYMYGKSNFSAYLKMGRAWIHKFWLGFMTGITFFFHGIRICISNPLVEPWIVIPILEICFLIESLFFLYWQILT